MSTDAPAAPCPRCGGTGWYAYDDVHSKPCEVCCAHDQGFSVLTAGYAHAGMPCCRRGCGYVKKPEQHDRRRIA